MRDVGALLRQLGKQEEFDVSSKMEVRRFDRTDF